jgi:hypothetical protein
MGMGKTNKLVNKNKNRNDPERNQKVIGRVNEIKSCKNQPGNDR